MRKRPPRPRRGSATKDARRAAAAEAAEKAKAAAAEAAALKKREEDERRAAAAEAERQTKQAEADRKAREAQQKAEQAERAKAAAEAAAAATAAQKQTEQAEAARRKAELAAQKEAACKDEQGKLDAILAKGSEGTGVDDLKKFSQSVTCERLSPVVTASLDRFNTEAARRAAEAPNALPLVRSAQMELIRLGCYVGRPDGSLTSTQSALSRYLKIEGQPSDNPVVTKTLVAELVKHSTRVCPLECRTGETRKGEVCVADEKAQPAPPPATASRKSNDDEDNARSRRKQQATRDQDQPRRQPKQIVSQPELPRARVQALARPSITSGRRWRWWRWWRRWRWRSQHHDWRWLLIAVLLGFDGSGRIRWRKPMRWPMNSISRTMSRFAAVAGFAAALWVASPATAAEPNATRPADRGPGWRPNGDRARQAPSPLAAVSRCLLVCVAHAHRRCELGRPVMLLVVRAVDPPFHRDRLLELLQSAPMPQR